MIPALNHPAPTRAAAPRLAIRAEIFHCEQRVIVEHRGLRVYHIRDAEHRGDVDPVVDATGLPHNAGISQPSVRE